jgi:hypothetical protein
MKQYNGNFEATMKTDEFMTIAFDLQEFEQKLNMNVVFKDNEWVPVGLFYMGHPYEWDCPGCGESHWSKDTMTCDINDNLMMELWDRITDSPEFKAYIYGAMLEDIIN